MNNEEAGTMQETRFRDKHEIRRIKVGRTSREQGFKRMKVQEKTSKKGKNSWKGGVKKIRLNCWGFETS